MSTSIELTLDQEQAQVLLYLRFMVTVALGKLVNVLYCCSLCVFAVFVLEKVLQCLVHNVVAKLILCYRS